MRTARLFLFLGAATALASCSLTLWDYSNTNSKKYALVYGVTRYTMSQPGGTYPNLHYPDADAQEVASMLRAEGYFVVLRYVDGPGDEWLITPTSSTNLGNIGNPVDVTNSPSKQNISQDIATYFQGVVGSNDIFLFYFSGHGMQDTSVSPPVEYFVPEGAVTSTYQGDPTLSVSNVEMGSMLSSISTKRKVVILDTCNSGGFIANSLEADSIPQSSLGSSGGISIQTLTQAISNYANFPSSSDGLSPYGDAMVLSASGRDESCYEDGSPYNHGVMTYYLLKARQSGDLNNDGHVTVGEAFSLVKAGIDSDWNANASVQAQGLSFEPRISGGPIDFVLW